MEARPMICRKLSRTTLFQVEAKMATVGWAPLGPNGGSVSIGSPYIRNDAHLIVPSQDFTVRLTTISKSLLDNYGKLMQRGHYDNDFFCLISHFGIGDNGERMPSTSINYVAREKSISTDVLSLWGENIRCIRDYRDQGTEGNAGRLYIGTSAFCQGLGHSRLDNVHEAFHQVSSLIGRFAPWLTPYTTVSNLAIEGVSMLLKKLINHKSECVESCLTLYPGTLDKPLPQGDAYLQTGSYIFFFEDLSNSQLGDLFLTNSGQVAHTNNNSVRIPPYVVINIADGAIDAPSEIASRAVAVDILEKYQSRYSLEAELGNGSMELLLEGLRKIGDSYIYISKLNRFRELFDKGLRRSPKETQRMNAIKAEIEDKFPQIKLAA